MRSENSQNDILNCASGVLPSKSTLAEHRPINVQPLLSPKSLQLFGKDLARFARAGGPDLDDLRGFGSFVTTDPSDMESTEDGCELAKPRKSVGQSTDFHLELLSHGIYMNDVRSQPKNLVYLRELVQDCGVSFRFANYTVEAFENLQRESDRLALERSIISHVISEFYEIPKPTDNEDVWFTRMKPFWDKAPNPRPDRYDGADRDEIHEDILQDGDTAPLIIPTVHEEAYIAPNFFFEVKGPKGIPFTARKQAAFDGAHGALAMLALQWAQQPDKVYDEIAHTFSATYCDGHLRIFSHHATPPKRNDGSPEYHMSQLGGWSMTGDVDSFRRGATALACIRAEAKRCRDLLLAAANQRAIGVRAALVPDGSEYPWVRTYSRADKVCFDDFRGETVETETGNWKFQHLEDGRMYYTWQSPATKEIVWTSALPWKDSGDLEDESLDEDSLDDDSTDDDDK